MGYSYEYEWDKEYCYPDSGVLINKLGIKNHDELVTADEIIIASAESFARDYDKINAMFERITNKK